MRRRDFLKALGGMLAGAALAPWELLAKISAAAPLSYKGVPIQFENEYSADLKRMYNHVYAESLKPKPTAMMCSREVFDSYCELAGVDPEEVLMDEEDVDFSRVLDMRPPAQRQESLLGLMRADGNGWGMARRRSA
ncbi:MAG: hypothetical protein V3W28_06100 [Thermoplasmata archaeon]